MPASLIAADDAFSILALFFGIVVLALLVERTPVGKRLSAVMVVIIGTATLGNLRVLPQSAPTYDLIWTYLVPFAIALFLLKADLISVVREGGRVMIAFLFGAAGILLGAVIATSVLDLGPDTPAYAAVMAASYTGGSLNFAAVADAIGFRDQTKLATAVTVDNVVGLGFLILIGFAASLSLFQRRYAWRADAIFGEETGAGDDGRPIDIFGLTTALAAAAAACAIGIAIADAAGVPDYSILFITVLMVAVATAGRRFLVKLRGEDTIAMIFMYLFFAMIGAGVDLFSLDSTALGLFALIVLMVLVHGVFLLIGGHLFKLNYAELIVASLACIGGPPLALSIAVLFGWRALAIPGIALGIFGYVVGTFLGVGLYGALGG